MAPGGGVIEPASQRKRFTTMETAVRLGDGRRGSMAAGVVPPPPSMQGTDGGGRGLKFAARSGWVGRPASAFSPGRRPWRSGETRGTGRWRIAGCAAASVDTRCRERRSGTVVVPLRGGSTHCSTSTLGAGNWERRRRTRSGNACQRRLSGRGATPFDARYRTRRSGRLGALGGGGSSVVPPPPSIQGTGHGGTGRLGTLAGGGLPVVPPPPSMQGTGTGGGAGGGGSGRGFGIVGW
jgi:hypothetical protein